MKNLLILIALISFGVPARASVRDDLKKYQGTEKFKEHEAAVIAAGKLIQRLPRNMEGFWGPKEIDTIIDLLLTEKDAVYRQEIIEAAVVNFQDNRKAFGDAVNANKKIAAQDKKDLLYDIDAMVNQHDRGQDPKKSKPN